MYTHVRCFQVSSIPWYQRRAASLLGTLPSSSYEEAIGFFEKCDAISPKPFTPNWLYLGKCYMNMKKWAEAKKWFTKVIEEDGNQSDPDHVEVNDVECYWLQGLLTVVLHYCTC